MDKLASEIFSKLNLRFGVAKCELNFKNNFELVVAVVLSARCTDKRVNLITKELFLQYPNAFSLAKAKIEDIEKIIYSCGFYKNKAKSLLNLSKDLVEKFNGDVPSDYDDLVKLRGVGRKTANVVLSNAFSKPAIAVDTHVFRVSNRLGLVNAKTPLECELALQKRFDIDKWSQLHHYLVLFGRYVCKSQGADCQNCEFKDVCKKFNNIDYIDKKY